MPTVGTPELEGGNCDSILIWLKLRVTHLNFYINVIVNSNHKRQIWSKRLDGSIPSVSSYHSRSLFCFQYRDHKQFYMGSGPCWPLFRTALDVPSPLFICPNLQKKAMNHQLKCNHSAHDFNITSNQYSSPKSPPLLIQMFNVSINFAVVPKKASRHKDCNTL